MSFDVPLLPSQIRNAGDCAAFICLDAFHYRFGCEFTVTRYQSAGDHCVLRTTLGVRRAGESDAILAGNAGVPTTVWQSVDKQWDWACYPTHLLSATFQRNSLRA